MNMINSIRKKLEDLSDIKLKEFNSKLSPNICKDNILGIKIPTLRKFSKSLNDSEKEKFILSLPNKYLEEIILHSIILSEIKDVNELFARLDDYLPFVMSWCDCDTIKPLIFKKIHNENIHSKLIAYAENREEYVCRFGLVSLLSYYTKEYFNVNDIEVIKDIKSNYYYVNMAISWYFSELLVNQYNSVISLFESNELDLWIHNKSLQKALESFRIGANEKQYIRSLKRIV